MSQCYKIRYALQCSCDLLLCTFEGRSFMGSCSPILLSLSSDARCMLCLFILHAALKTLFFFFYLCRPAALSFSPTTVENGYKVTDYEVMKLL